MLCMWVSLEFHMTFENLFICQLLTFCFEKNSSHVHVFWRQCQPNTSTYTSQVCPPCFFFFFACFFPFLFQNKPLSSLGSSKNPLLRTSDFFNGVQLKTQNVPFRSLIDRVVFSQKYLYQLWKLFCWIRNQINIAIHAQKGVKCPLI